VNQDDEENENMMTGNAASLTSPTADMTEHTLTSSQRELLSKFRRTIQVLGAVWVLCGLVLTGLALAGGSGGGTGGLPNAGLLWLEGGLQLALGVFVYRKNMTATKLGLGLAYASGVVKLLTGATGNFILVIALVLQSHKALRQARQLQSEGISLTQQR
jgi:hypothetical protein